MAGQIFSKVMASLICCLGIFVFGAGAYLGIINLTDNREYIAIKDTIMLNSKSEAESKQQELWDAAKDVGFASLSDRVDISYVTNTDSYVLNYYIVMRTNNKPMWTTSVDDGINHKAGDWVLAIMCTPVSLFFTGLLVWIIKEPLKEFGI